MLANSPTKSTALTTSQKGAPTSVVELSDTLFGLRCALEHLSHHAGKIQCATSLADWEANKMRQDLHTMAGNCAATLNSLQEILDKYTEDILDVPAANVPWEKLGNGAGIMLCRA
jgi:hypothetical protein